MAILLVLDGKSHVITIQLPNEYHYVYVLYALSGFKRHALHIYTSHSEAEEHVTIWGGRK